MATTIDGVGLSAPRKSKGKGKSKEKVRAARGMGWNSRGEVIIRSSDGQGAYVAGAEWHRDSRAFELTCTCPSFLYSHQEPKVCKHLADYARYLETTTPTCRKQSEFKESTFHAAQRREYRMRRAEQEAEEGGLTLEAVFGGY